MLINLEALPPLASVDDAIAILAGAMNGQAMPERRIFAAADSHAPSEGLALLDAYISITDAKVRQAVLDVVLAIAAQRSKP